jgi:hypothetical protein
MRQKDLKRKKYNINLNCFIQMLKINHYSRIYYIRENKIRKNSEIKKNKKEKLKKYSLN